MIEFAIACYIWIAGYLFSLTGSENDSRPVIIERLIYSTLWLFVGATMLSSFMATKILGEEK